MRMDAQCEEDVGITEYAGTAPGFTAILKQRFVSARLSAVQLCTGIDCQHSE